MNRRQFIAGSLTAAALSFAGPGRAASSFETRWIVRESEGLDALCFLCPLSEAPLYQRFYADDVAAFRKALPGAAVAEAAALWREAEDEGFGLLGPNLCTMFSGLELASIDMLVRACSDLSGTILPAYRASPYWDENDWAWVSARAERFGALFAAMRDAGFSDFRGLRAAGLAERVVDVGDALADYDVVHWQRKLTGRAFDPKIAIVLLQFSKPHGIKVQGQTFLQSADYDTATTVRIAAHEMLHPPFPMDGPAATGALEVLADDPLIARIVRDHDPKWGYTTLDGLLNEDVCEALDQLISEALGVARNPADRWRKADDGIHVLAAGLYGMLRQDKWVETGGDIEEWISEVAASGRLSPAELHPVAARVLERPVDTLWPLV